MIAVLLLSTMVLAVEPFGRQEFLTILVDAQTSNANYKAWKASTWTANFGAVADPLFDAHGDYYTVLVGTSFLSAAPAGWIAAAEAKGVRFVVSDESTALALEAAGGHVYPLAISSDPESIASGGRWKWVYWKTTQPDHNLPFLEGVSVTANGLVVWRNSGADYQRRHVAEALGWVNSGLLWTATKTLAINAAPRSKALPDGKWIPAMSAAVCHAQDPVQPVCPLTGTKPPGCRDEAVSGYQYCGSTVSTLLVEIPAMADTLSPGSGAKILIRPIGDVADAYLAWAASDGFTTPPTWEYDGMSGAVVGPATAPCGVTP